MAAVERSVAHEDYSTAQYGLYSTVRRRAHVERTRSALALRPGSACRRCGPRSRHGRREQLILYRTGQDRTGQYRTVQYNYQQRVVDPRGPRWRRRAAVPCEAAGTLRLAYGALVAPAESSIGGSTATVCHCANPP